MRSTFQHILILTLMTISCYQIYINMPTYIHLCSNIESSETYGLDFESNIIEKKGSKDFTSIINDICHVANIHNVYLVSNQFVLNRTNYNKIPKLNNIVLINILAIGIESLLLGLL